MVQRLGKNTTLTGRSGKEYVFSLWSFDDFDDIKRTFTGGGLYLFSYRQYVLQKYWHTYVYLGETEDYYTRFDSHHKESCIRNKGANCIGFLSMQNATEQMRKDAEKDLLNNYSFPCNSNY